MSKSLSIPAVCLTPTDEPVAPFTTTEFTIESPSTYVPMDRRHALVAGATLPERVRGAAFFADVSGFTSMTETLTHDLGSQRGSEEITRLLNCVYDAIISELHLYGGSAISFGGDAITCWFDGDDGLRATAAGLAMQRAVQPFATRSLTMKVAIAVGPAKRFVVGDPQFQLLDALAGATIDTLTCVEKHADAGEVLLDRATATALGDTLAIRTWREDSETGEAFAVVGGLTSPVAPVPWPSIVEQNVVNDLVRPWLIPAVYERLRDGQGEFLAELRPVVVLFLRFTGIDYDAEAGACAKLDAFIRQVQEILASHDGTLLQVMFGDKGSYLYAAFGAPVAHEDDAYRAAVAALKLNQLAQTAEHIKSIQIGLAQGIARTGAYGGKMRRTYGVLGDTVNLSARLMQAAAPAQILASIEVYHALANEFIWETLPTIRVKGKDEAVAVYGLLASKSQQAQRENVTQNELPMVGRERELAQITERLDLAAQGRGQIVGVTAEPGMGKSRLIAEVVRLADGQGWLRYEGECSSSGTNTSYQVWYTIWRQFYELDTSWPLPVQIRTLEAQLAQIDPTFRHRLPLLGAAVNLPIPDNDLTAAFDAKLRKSSLESLLVDCLRTKCQQGPILIVLEDCHWLDPLSHDLLDVIAKAIVDLPVLVLLAFRSPQLQYLREPRVSALAHYVGIDLASLTPEEARQLIQLKLARNYGAAKPIPAELIERISKRAEGNPFFVEELLDYLKSLDVDPQDAETLAKLDLPISLQSLILSRIDQLAESQRITLKAASIIGRVFETPTLWGFYPQLGGEPRVRQDLEVLRIAGLTEPMTEASTLIYAFRHVLMQEVAHESLPSATRASLHEQLALFIEHSHEHVLDQVLDQLAYHYGQSHNTTKKREYLLQAGQRAQQVYANRAAIDYYRLVLPLLADDEKPTVLLDLGKVQELVGSWQEAKATYEQALALAQLSDDRQIQAWSEIAIGHLLRKQGLYADAAAWLAQAKLNFEQVDDRSGFAQVLHDQGTLAAYQGDLEAAQRLFEDSLAMRQALGDQANIANLYSNLGILARQRGHPETARKLYEESLVIRQDLGDRWAIGVSLNNIGYLALLQGDSAEAQSHLEKALVIYRELGDRWAIANTLHNLANVARETDDFTPAMALYHESLTTNRELGDKVALAYLFEDIGCLAARQDAPHRALRLIGAATALREAVGAPLSPSEQALSNECLTSIRQQLPEEDQLTADAEGRALALVEAIEFALRCTEC